MEGEMFTYLPVALCTHISSIRYLLYFCFLPFLILFFLAFHFFSMYCIASSLLRFVDSPCPPTLLRYLPSVQLTSFIVLTSLRFDTSVFNLTAFFFESFYSS